MYFSHPRYINLTKTIVCTTQILTRSEKICVKMTAHIQKSLLTTLEGRLSANKIKISGCGAMMPALHTAANRSV